MHEISTGEFHELKVATERQASDEVVQLNPNTVEPDAVMLLPAAAVLVPKAVPLLSIVRLLALVTVPAAEAV